MEAVGGAHEIEQHDLQHSNNKDNNADSNSNK